MSTRQATPAELAEAQLLWENFNASGMVREYISKERGEQLDRGIICNEVNIPKYNVITLACIVGACEVALGFGAYIGWRLWR